MYNKDLSEYAGILEKKIIAVASDKHALDIQVSELLDTLKKINSLNSLGKTKEIADTINNIIK